MSDSNFVRKLSDVTVEKCKIRLRRVSATHDSIPARQKVWVNLKLHCVNYGEGVFISGILETSTYV